MSSIEQVQIGKVTVTTHVITTIEQLDQGLRELLWLTVQHEGLKHVISLDINNHYSPSSSISPTFTTSTHTEKVATLVLCCGNSCLIIQLLQIDSLYASCYLSEFLQLDGLTFVGVGIQHCLEALQRDYGIKCRNASDLSQISLNCSSNKAKGCGIVDVACKAAKMQAFVGVKEARRICNAANLSDWGAAVLSKLQIESATTRVYLCFYVCNYFYDGYCKRFRFWERGYDYYYTISKPWKFLACCFGGVGYLINLCLCLCVFHGWS